MCSTKSTDTRHKKQDMSLRSIHLIFIVSSIVLAILVAIWSIGMYASGQGSVGHAAFSVGSILSGSGLAVYLVAFLRKTRAIGMK